ncbi:MAG: GDP-mannose 4,6-dehydratase [Candidatus Omnitrophota bacterium]|nr:GDP-mannose 4,6-dehydratase [Candidatus Omnitrophota bacterium]
MDKLVEDKILITGGAGFVGSHLTEELMKDDKQVVIVDDFSNGRMENLESVKEKIDIITGDISISFPEFKELLKDYKFEKIFHLACHPRSLSLSNPFRDLEVNAKGTLNVLELARSNSCKVIFTSNSGIYGDPEYLPIDEKHPDKPTTPYDANKLVAEYYMKIYHKIYGLPVAMCRLATVYGERQRTKPDWKPVIAEFAQKILKNETPTICWDGQQTRDLIYVKDVVQGLIKASNSETKDEVFILGTNVETSINEIYEVICKILNEEIEPKREKKIDGDIRKMKLSYKKAKETFGFEPKYSVEQGTEYYINWLQKLKEE